MRSLKNPSSVSSLALVLAALCAFVACAGSAVAQRSPAAPYAGQEQNRVSTLSADDVSELLAGGGWGLAKPAEFNGYPGPAHVLELADKLELTPDQRKSVERIFKRMQAKARSLGQRYVASEIALDSVFKSGITDTGALTTRLRDAERLRAELRRAHLQAHVETAPLLTDVQKRKYAELRGYGASATPHDHQHMHKH